MTVWTGCSSPTIRYLDILSEDLMHVTDGFRAKDTRDSGLLTTLVMTREAAIAQSICLSAF